jgi:hypothetical protein
MRRRLSIYAIFGDHLEPEERFVSLLEYDANASSELAIRSRPAG